MRTHPQKTPVSLVNYIENIYQLLADDRLGKLGLFSIEIEKGELVTPLADDALSLMSYRSKRSDGVIEQTAMEGIVAAIVASPNYKGINHVGFCYKVRSKEDEVKRISEAASSRGFRAYQEPSSDDAAWVFVGNISEITNPLLEFLPHEGQTNDKWVDHWLPHIQFDVDTGLSPDEIKTIVRRFIDRPFTPYSIQIDGVTYIQRVNLGCLEGVNIMLDIATNNRNVNYRKTWTELT